MFPLDEPIPLRESDQPLQERVQGLDDRSALAALHLLAENHRALPDVGSARVVEDGIGEALGQDEMRGYEAGPSPASPRGEVARLALLHLAEQSEESAAEVEQAIAQGSETRWRTDPLTLGMLGAAVLYAFSTEIKLEHQPGSGWSFRFHHRPLKESTTGQLLGQLLRLWRPPGS